MKRPGDGFTQTTWYYCPHCKKKGYMRMYSEGVSYFWCKYEKRTYTDWPMGLSIAAIIKAIATTKFKLENEKVLHSQIEELFKNSSFTYEREYHLDERSIIDFKIGDVGIEVKLNYQGKRAIFDQCQRYSKFEELNAIILVTNAPMGKPKFENQKPFYIINLGGAWL